MFRARNVWEIELMRVFNDECRCWSLMEQTTNIPWFHVSVERMDPSEGLDGRRYLVDDVSTLARIVAEQEDNPYIRCVMVILPPAMHAKCEWGMKRLTDLKEITDSTGALFYEYATDAGTFCNIPESERQTEIELVTTVYNESRDSISRIEEP
jgi:hypothetical protein